jgi:hypothetical protein
MEYKRVGYLGEKSICLDHSLYPMFVETDRPAVEGSHKDVFPLLLQ